MAFLGWSKGPSGWAHEWVNNNIGDPGCTITRALPDIQSDIAMKSEVCASWVKSRRFGASRANALSYCQQYIADKYACQISGAQASNFERDKKVEETLFNAKSPLFYIVIFVMVALIFYLIIF